MWAVYQLCMGMKARYAMAIVAVTALGLFYFVGYCYRMLAGESNEGEAEVDDKKEQ